MYEFHIYQDLDGCLSDFVGQVEIEINKLVTNQINIESKSLRRSLRKYIAMYGKSYRKLTNDDLKCKVTRNIMYKVAAEKDFFRKLSLLDNGLWEKMQNFQDRMTFLTAPIGDYAKADKKAWCAEVLGSNCNCIVVPRVEKVKHSGPYAVLIDDHFTTIQEWKDAGGLAFHWPTDREMLFLFLESLKAVEKKETLNLSKYL